MTEIVRDESTGLLVPAGDPLSLARALERILTNREVAERMGSEGRAVALAEFTEDRMVDRFVATYERMTAAPVISAAHPSNIL